MKKYCRTRHKDPEYFDENSLRIKEIKKGYKIIIGCKKGYFKNGVCIIGTELQSELKPLSLCPKGKNDLKSKDYKPFLSGFFTD